MRSPTSFLITAFIVAFCVLLLIPLWYILGAVGGEAHAHAMVTIEPPDYFAERLAQQMKRYGQADGSIRLTNSGDVYILAAQFAFIPNTIRFETGKKYSLHFYSPDVIHGVSLIYVDQYGVAQPFALNNVVPPGLITSVTIEPHLPGTILIVCGEYCGRGHHLMQSKITVTGQPYPMAVIPWYQRIGALKLPVPMWLYHDLYLDQVAPVNPEIIWSPPETTISGVFMAPHGEWQYWHYHGPPENEEELLWAADMSDGKLDGRIAPGTPGVPAQLIEHFNLPSEKTKLYPNRPTR